MSLQSCTPHEAAVNPHHPSQLQDHRRRQRPRHPRYHAGLSLVEMLVSLAITAMLLTATMVATDASFRAYANASEQFSTQATTRMMTGRLLSLLRTSTAHAPLDADGTCTPAATRAGDLITSPYVEMIDANNHLMRIEYRTAAQELWLIQSNLDGSNKIQQPILGGVTAAQFTCLRRRTNSGQWILERATMDLTILPGNATADANGQSTFNSEHAAALEPLRVVGSTKPRKLADQ